MKEVEQICPLEDLQTLLENQIEMLRKSNFSAVEALAEKAELLVREIVKTKEFEQPKFAEKRNQVMKLYKTMELMAEAGKDSVAKQLKQVANGKKTLRKYRNMSLI